MRGASSSAPAAAVVNGEPEGLRAAVAADVGRPDDQVVDAVTKRARVELRRELEEVRALLEIGVVPSEDGLVLIRPAGVDLPEGEVLRHRGAEVHGHALPHDDPARDVA